MAEYIERGAVLKALHSGNIDMGMVTTKEYRLLKDLSERIDRRIQRVPVADVAPVVRCKDCRHRDPEDHKCDSGEFERQGCPFKVADNYFCAYGERR